MPPEGAAGGGAPAYRADIDGLRAVAVAGVVAFHYGLGPVGGGFAGVDVFFAISGYLVAAILRRAPQGAGALADFAERRVRRIVPALLVVAAVTTVAATTMLPNDLQAVGLGLLNAVLFTANHYFATLADDYFAAGTLALQPMLHCWSLAVEAQFYLVFALLWAALRGGPAKGRAIVLAVLAAGSFAASLAAVALRPAWAFDLLPFRFWEFCAGAGLALVPPARRPRAGVAAGAATAGLALIGLAFFGFDARTPFPGAAALLPVVGAALLIGAGHRPNPVSRALGAPPLAALGRLSYTLYLWHWPVLALAGYGRPHPLPLGERLALLALALLLAWLTTRLVERPLIERRLLARPRPFLLAAAAGTAMVAAGATVLNLAGQNLLPLRQPLPAAVLRLAAAAFDTPNFGCPVTAQPGPACRFGRPGAAPSVLLWGNSFARQWLPALDTAARRQGAAGLALLMVRCPPFVGAPLPALRGCAAFNTAALAFVEARPALRTVVLGGDWSLWTDDRDGLSRTVEALIARGRRVAVVLSPPAVPYPVPRMLALATLRGEPAPPLVSEAAARADRAMETAMAAALAARGVVVVDPLGAFCDGRGCAVQAEGQPLYYDERHITRFAAARAAALFDPVFAAASPGP